jgi:membrane glycosyltransferase
MSTLGTDTEQSKLADDRRQIKNDRRKHHIRALRESFVRRRRKGPRRDTEDTHNYYVDVHEPVLFILAIAILVLCVADAFFTMTILSMGGVEVNPFMRALIERDILLFFSVKFILTAIFLIFTVIHKRFKIFGTVSGYHILYGVFIMYVTLIVYELYLLYIARG